VADTPPEGAAAMAEILRQKRRAAIWSGTRDCWNGATPRAENRPVRPRLKPRVAEFAPMPGKSNRIIVTVIGADTVGIIAKVSALLAEANVNIIDISQTTVREFFAMIMLADMEKATVPFDDLKRRLNAKGEELGLRIDAQHEDVFKFMHRV
jgi:ACT domain-containing protein